MQADKEILNALNEKAREQSDELTSWLQMKFGLSSEYVVKAKLTLSVKRHQPPKLMINPQDWVFDQPPTLKDWQIVKSKVKALSVGGKSYQRSRHIWRHMLRELGALQRCANVAPVRNATRLNVYLQHHNLPYRLVRVEKHYEDPLYSLLVAKINPSPMT